MATIPQAIQQGVSLHQAGQLHEAQSIYETILSQVPNQPDALHLLGVIYQQQGHIKEAIALLQQACEAQPNNATYLSNIAIAYFADGQKERATEMMHKVVELNPNHAQAQNNLGRNYAEKGQWQQAIAYYQKAIQVNPSYAQAHCNIIDALIEKNYYQQAIPFCQALVKLRPSEVEPMTMLGRIYRFAGDFKEAITTLRHAVEMDPTYKPALINLADVYSENTSHQLAAETYEKLVALDPENTNILNMLGIYLRQATRTDEAVAAYRKAIALEPNFAIAHSNFGIALKSQGKLSEALIHYRKANELEPTETHLSNLLFSLNYDPNTTAEQLFNLHQEWRDLYGPLSLATEKHHNQPTTNRPLKIGYVSGDLNLHPVTRFIESLIKNHDPKKVLTYLYANQPANDRVSVRLHQKAHQWVNTYTFSDEKLFQQIQRDQIDILVDLSGHSARNRLSMFAQKPAPVQVSYLGYPNTSGVAAMDYYISDEIADPAGYEKYYLETLLRVKNHSFACFQTPKTASEVSPSPAKKNGFITFGSLLDMAKINPQVLDLWCKLIRETPNSKLFFFRSTLRGSLANQLKRALLDRQLTESQFEIQSDVTIKAGFLSVYQHIDISLDSFPWSGHTTGCESLWMGVPVLTLAGDRHASRMLASVLTNAGLEKFATYSPKAFIETGQWWANHLDELAALRNGLREQMRHSPLCNGQSFAQEIESLYADIWKCWCDKQTTSP